MGKNKIRKSLIRCVGNVAWHKLLLKNTNKSESKNRLETEILEYGFNALEKAQDFNWNNEDKKIIKEKALERLQNLSQNYEDVSYKLEDAKKIIKETIEDLMG